MDMEKDMTEEHHHQRVDLESGYIEATRDDTDEYQDLRVKAYINDGQQVYEGRFIYNIQYDYYRRREWYDELLTQDELFTGQSYGHLQEEFAGLKYPPEGWVNPYPDNYEPVKKEGADIFHREGRGLCISIYLKTHEIRANVNFYIWNDLENWRKTDKNLITDIDIEELETPYTPRPPPDYGQ